MVSGHDPNVRRGWGGGLRTPGWGSDGEDPRRDDDEEGPRGAGWPRVRPRRGGVATGGVSRRGGVAAAGEDGPRQGRAAMGRTHTRAGRPRGGAPSPGRGGDRRRASLGRGGNGEARRWAILSAIAVGEGLFWVRDPFTIHDANYKIGPAFRSSLLETVLPYLPTELLHVAAVEVEWSTGVAGLVGRCIAEVQRSARPLMKAQQGYFHSQGWRMTTPGARQINVGVRTGLVRFVRSVTLDDDDGVPRSPCRHPLLSWATIRDRDRRH